MKFDLTDEETQALIRLARDRRRLLSDGAAPRPVESGPRKARPAQTGRAAAAPAAGGRRAEQWAKSPDRRWWRLGDRRL